MFCHKCGTQVNDDTIFCPKCGEKLIADEVSQESIPQSYVMDTVQQEATRQVKTKKPSPKAIALFGISAIAIVAALLFAFGPFKNGNRVKDQYAANGILGDWIEEHVPISKTDPEYRFGFAGTGWCPNETIGGENYFVEAVTVSYNNKNYYPYKFQYHIDPGPAENDIISGHVYIKETDGSMYISFGDSMEPIDSWYETFDDWVVTVADPEIYKNFTTKKPATGPATIDDAMEIFEKWETTHPLDPNYAVRPGYDDADNNAFTLFLWGYEAELGTIYVNKTDGSMKMVSDFIEYDLDDWYNGDTSEGVDVEPEYNPYLNLDASLVGRWRSYDGGTLEFTDSGVISSCDFQCWSMVGEDPARIYWEASNGRVTCSAYYDRDVTYGISERSDGSEYIVLSINRDHKYTRVTGKNGDGIVGKWESTYGTFWSYQFNADGTGMYNGTYPLNWYAYTRDDGASAVSYSLLDRTYFDYSVSGNILTVFLSNSSRVYTKVSS